MRAIRRSWLCIGACVLLLCIGAAAVTAVAVQRSHRTEPSGRPPAMKPAVAFIATPTPRPGEDSVQPSALFRKLGLMVGNTIVVEVAGVHTDVAWTTGGRYVFAVNGQAAITVIDAQTAAVTSVACGCTAAVRYGESGVAWLDGNELFTADLAGGGGPVADPRRIPAAPEPSGDSLLIAMAGGDAVLRQTVTLGARLGVERVVKVSPDGTTTVLLAKTPVLQTIRADRSGRIAFVVTSQASACVVQTVEVLQPDGRTQKAGLAGMLDGPVDDAATVVHDLYWDAEGRLHVGATVGRCATGAAEADWTSAMWSLTDSGTEGLPLARSVGGNRYAVTADGHMTADADRRVLLEGVAQIEMSPRQFAEPSFPVGDIPVTISAAGAGAARLGGPVRPLMGSGLFTTKTDHMCEGTLLVGQGPFADVEVYTDIATTTVEQVWIGSERITTAAGIHVGSTETEVRAAYGSALRQLNSTTSPGSRHLLLGDGGNSVVFVIPAGSDKVTTIIVMSTELAEASIDAMETIC